jgi:hypothetical protein
VLDEFPDDNCISFDSCSPVQNIESVIYYDIQLDKNMYLIKVTTLLI